MLIEKCVGLSSNQFKPVFYMNKEPLNRFLQSLKQFVLKEKVTGSKKAREDRREITTINYQCRCARGADAVTAYHSYSHS